MGGGSSAVRPAETSRHSRIVDESVDETNAIQQQESTNYTTHSVVKDEEPKLEKPLQWPLPIRDKEKEFVVNTLPMYERYSLSEDRYSYNEANVQRSIKATTISIRPTRKLTTQTTENGDSNAYHSANTKLLMQAKTDLWAGISSSAEMQSLLASLNAANMEASEVIQQRLQKLSRDAERIMGLIIDDTTDEQNRLLEYAQEIQVREEELYREWLQKYLVELDKWRSYGLEQLRENVDHYKEHINTVAYQKLAFVNQQVRKAKSGILREEYKRQSKKADQIVFDIEKLSQKNDMQHFGTESYTDIHLKIQGNVGSKGFDEKRRLNDPFILKREYVTAKLLTD